MTKKSNNGSTSLEKVATKGRMEEVYLKAAMLFKENGYFNTSVNQIARELDIKKGSLYYYISDKETLLFEILNRTMNTMLELVQDIPSGDFSPDQKLELAIQAHIVNAVRYLNQFSVLLHDTKHLGPDKREIILSKRKQYENIFLSIINEGVSKKIFKKLDKKLLVYMILGSCNWLYQWFSPEGTKNPDQIAEIFSEVCLNGIRLK